MPVLGNLIRSIRKTGDNPALKESLANWSWPFKSLTGATVNDQTALSLTAFYRGVSLIASTVAGLPLHIHQENNDGTNEQIKTSDTMYLWRRPNPEMTKQTFWERVVADEVRGNAFIFVEKNGQGGVQYLWHIERQRVKVGRTSSGMKVYEIDEYQPMLDYKEGGEIVHIPNWGDGLVGYDPVKVAVQAIALGLSAEEYAARYFGQGMAPPGILSSDMTLSPEDSDDMATRFALKYGGTQNVGKPVVLGKGAKFQQLAVDPEKAQMDVLRRFQVAEIARLLGIPPHLLGDVERSTSWGSGIAEQGQGFVTYTLNPHTTRIEQAIDDALLVRELTNRYCNFDPGGLLRGNLLQQYQAHVLGWGRFLTTNEIRKDLNLPPVPGGDVLMQPSNMAPIDAFEGMKIGQGGQPRE